MKTMSGLITFGVAFTLGWVLLVGGALEIFSGDHLKLGNDIPRLSVSRPRPAAPPTRAHVAHA